MRGFENALVYPGDMEKRMFPKVCTACITFLCATVLACDNNVCAMVNIDALRPAGDNA